MGIKLLKLFVQKMRVLCVMEFIHKRWNFLVLPSSLHDTNIYFYFHYRTNHMRTAAANSQQPTSNPCESNIPNNKCVSKVRQPQE